MNDFDPVPIAGRTFNDQALLLRALTHRSFLNEHPEEAVEDNERLEFLGDAVLSLITAEYLYHHFPELREGPLTRLRASLVRKETLADLAVQIGLDKRLLLGRGEEDAGGRQRTALLCDVFESYIGALYLDQGMPAVLELVLPLMRPALERIVAPERNKESRGELQELVQGRFQLTPRYRTVDEWGPDHAREFVVEVYVGDRGVGRGRGNKKQTAAKEAAADALSRLGDLENLSDVPPLPEWHPPAAS